MIHVKDIMELIQKGMTVKAQEKIIELREHALSLQEENQELKAKLQMLEEQMAIDKNLDFESGVYWMKKEDGTRDGPYCQRCWDADQKLIRLQLQPNSTHYRCFECRHSYIAK